MKIKANAIKIITILLSLIIFGISLTQNAIIIDYQGTNVIASLDYFLMGSTAFIGGGFLEQIIWMANPISLFAIILLVANHRLAIFCSLIALVLSVSFGTWNEILGAESGSMATILSLELGYYLWVLSILILTGGIFWYFRNENLKPNHSDIQNI